jgi:chitosanase
MKPFMTLNLIAFVSVLGFLSAGCTKTAITSGALIKGSSSTVYYIGNDGRRYVFPNQAVYSSWYQNTNQSITMVNDQDIAALPLAGNITMRPGAYLVKIQTDPKVYAISPGGYLHWVINEQIARDLYGENWNKQIIDVPDAFFVNYLIDVPIDNSNSYDKNDAMLYTNDIETDLNARDNYSDDKWMSAEEKRIMYALTNLFESGKTFTSYAIIEILNDGRGYTAGKSGFTTATGDAYLVVKRYSELHPNNILAKYLPRLQELATLESDSLQGLDGFSEAWQRAALNPLFRQAQDEITDELYYIPAMQIADLISIKYALTRAFIYDTIIQHGNGNDPDGLKALITKATQITGGDPDDGISEKIWLSTLLNVRQDTLQNASDPKTRAVWADSAYRVNIYRKILETDNFNLNTPITIREQWLNMIIN